MNTEELPQRLAVNFDQSQLITSMLETLFGATDRILTFLKTHYPELSNSIKRNLILACDNEDKPEANTLDLLVTYYMNAASPENSFYVIDVGCSIDEGVLKLGITVEKDVDGVRDDNWTKDGTFHFYESPQFDTHIDDWAKAYLAALD